MRALGQKEADHNMNTRAKQEAKSAVRWRTGEEPLILAVDDQPEILEIIDFSLRSEGYRVALARNGREALAHVETTRPSLVIMDVTMPEMDGFEALRRLKEDPATEHLPVVMLTARSEEADILAGWLRGADLYLTKPFDPLELLAHVNHVLRDMQISDAEYFQSFSNKPPGPG
jgi:DNA-binding response OmpR family regulator